MDKRLWRNFDFLLLAATLALVGLGVAMIYSATYSPEVVGGVLNRPFIRQLIYAALGLCLTFLVAGIDYHFLADIQRPIYAIAILSLAAVFIIGRVLHGAQRWIDFRLFPFQPSELAKVLLVIVLAKYMADWQRRGNQLVNIFTSLALVSLPMVLIYLQPDLGTALVLAAVWLAMILMAGVRPLYILLLGLVALPTVPFIWLFVLKDYMRERFIIFLDPQLDPLGAGYNALQARISIGSGGLVGQGFMNGTQSQLHFLRVRHTDFIFSVLGEELGFVGALLLLLLMLIVLLRMVRVASIAGDNFGQLIATGVVTIILSQSFVNIAVNTGLLPTTGVPLPFVSYGGSSLVTLFIGQGLVQSVALRHRKIEF